MSKLTKAQAQWLTQLRDHGPKRSGSRTGYTCRIRGWSEWLVVLNDGRSVSISQALGQVEDEPPDIQWTKSGDLECITEAGRTALREAGQ